MVQRPEHVRADEVDAALTRQLAPSALLVRDDSAAHAGHAGAREGSHLHVTIVSARFVGLGRLARHRLVYDALGPLQACRIHALAIHAKAPEEG